MEPIRNQMNPDRILPLFQHSSIYAQAFQVASCLQVFRLEGCVHF
jgi:hypothetical protein